VRVDKRSPGTTGPDPQHASPAPRPHPPQDPAGTHGIDQFKQPL
jgi:hypothetical protein